MTEKQKNYILELDEFILDFAKFGEPEKLSSDILGSKWSLRYSEIPHQQASECISLLQDQAHRLGCYNNTIDIDNWYNGECS